MSVGVIPSPALSLSAAGILDSPGFPAIRAALGFWPYARTAGTEGQVVFRAASLSVGIAPRIATVFDSVALRGWLSADVTAVHASGSSFDVNHAGTRWFPAGELGGRAELDLGTTILGCLEIGATIPLQRPHLHAWTGRPREHLLRRRRHERRRRVGGRKRRLPLRWEVLATGDSGGRKPVPQLSAVWARSPTDVWIGGTWSVFHFDGSSWTQVSTQPEMEPIKPRSIGGCGAHVWIADVGDVLEFDGAQWSRTPVGPAISGVWGVSPERLVAVGPRGSILHRNP